MVRNSKTELSKEFKDVYNLWLLKKLPYQFQPQFYGFPFGYNGKPSYGIYSDTDGFTVGDTRISGLYGKGDTAKALGTFPSTSEFGYGTIKEAETECDLYEDCLYIANIPPHQVLKEYGMKVKQLVKVCVLQK